MPFYLENLACSRCEQTDINLWGHWLPALVMWVVVRNRKFIWTESIMTVCRKRIRKLVTLIHSYFNLLFFLMQSCGTIWSSMARGGTRGRVSWPAPEEVQPSTIWYWWALVWERSQHGLIALLTSRSFFFHSSSFLLSVALWRSVKNLSHVKKEHKELKRYVNEMKLVDAGVDPRPIELPSGQASAKGHIPHSSSYEDFKRQKLHQRSGASSSGAASPQPSFAIRKARSDPDVGMKNLQEDVEVSQK